MISNNSAYLLSPSYLHAKNIIHRDMKSNSIFYHFCNIGYEAKSSFLKHADMNIVLMNSLNETLRYIPAWRFDGEDRWFRSGHGQSALERLSSGGAAVGIRPLDGASNTHMPYAILYTHWIGVEMLFLLKLCNTVPFLINDQYFYSIY